MSASEDLPRDLLQVVLNDPAFVFKRDMLERLALAVMADDGGTWFECSRILKEKKMFKEVDKRVQALVREMREITTIGKGEAHSERSILDVWAEAPVDDSVYPPYDYAISDVTPAIERIEKRMMGDAPVEKRITVCRDPVLVTRRIGHEQLKTLLLEVRFKTHLGWRKCIADRDVFRNHRKIIDLARLGLPVSSGNALELAEWIAAYEDANRDRIPMGHASGQMGWQGEDNHPTHHGFLCGANRQIGGNGRAIELEGSDGQMRDAAEIRERGSFEKWNAAVMRLIHFPAVQIALCAAIAAPLMAILEAPIPIYEWAGRTSTGKSTVLGIAQSVWRSGKKHMETWDSTNTSFESAATFNCDLPIFLDETSLATGKGGIDIAKAIYGLVSGRGRGRSHRDGRNRIRLEWRTVVLATGEVPLGELVKKEGAAARVLTFWSAPLGETTPQMGTMISEVMHELGQNYGHAGPRVVQWLCDNREKWDDLRRLYQDTTLRVRNKICTPAASRLAEVVALLEVAACVGRASGVLPWIRGSLLDEPEIVEALRGAMTLASASSDRAYDAWEYVIGDALSRPRSWIKWGEEPKSDDRDPPGGWLGYYNANEWAFFPQQIRKILVAGGFSPEAAFRAWKDLGILIQPEKGRFTSQCRPFEYKTKLRLIRVKTEYPGHELDDD